MLWKNGRDWAVVCTVKRRKGSDDNYLARYDKIIVTRSIFIFFSSSRSRALYNVLAPFTTERIMNDGAILFAPQEVSIEKRFFTSSKYYKTLLSRWNAGGEWEASSKQTLRGSQQLNFEYILSLFFSSCNTQLTEFFLVFRFSFWRRKKLIFTDNFHKLQLRLSADFFAQKNQTQELKVSKKTPWLARDV